LGECSKIRVLLNKKKRFASKIHKTSTNKLLVIDLTKTGAVDALPLCGLIEAAVDMFIEVFSKNAGRVILNSDHIISVGYSFNKSEDYVINLDADVDLRPERTMGNYTKTYFISRREFEDIEKKLLAKK